MVPPNNQNNSAAGLVMEHVLIDCSFYLKIMPVMEHVLIYCTPFTSLSGAFKPGFPATDVYFIAGVIQQRSLNLTVTGIKFN